MHQSAHTTSLIGFEVVHRPSDMKRFDLSSWHPNSMPADTEQRKSVRQNQLASSDNGNSQGRSCGGRRSDAAAQGGSPRGLQNKYFK
jgi:hypothetical protein